MRTLLLTAFLAACLVAGPARAEVVQFVGKATSPNKFEVWSPHASDKEREEWEGLDADFKSKNGDEATAPGKPFTGRMRVLRVLAKVGDHVDPEQALMTYAFPLEDLYAERLKLSESDITSQESELAKKNAKLQAAQRDLEEYRRRLPKGLSSAEEIRDQAREVEVLRLKVRSIQESIQFDREMLKGELELARAKFGPKASSAGLPAEAKVLSQAGGFVLWVNPDLKPGVMLTKKMRLFVVGDMDTLAIRALVHEIQIPRLRVGDKASVTFDFLPGQVFPAEISRIQFTADTSANQLPSHFEVEITMPNPDHRIKDGVRGQVRVDVPDGPRE